MCKSMRKKALDEKKCLYSAMWMYTNRSTPLSHNMPSPYELMYGPKPRILIPSSNHALQSTHADNLDHRTNYTRRNKASTKTEKQVKLTGDLCTPTNLCMCTTPTQEHGTRKYMVEKDGKLHQRTGEHLRPRPVHQETSDRKLHPMTTFTLEPNQFPNLQIRPSTQMTTEPAKPETATQGKAGEPSTHPRSPTRTVRH